MNLYQVTCFPVRARVVSDTLIVKARSPRQAAEIVRDVIQEECDGIPGALIPGALVHVTHLTEPVAQGIGYCYPTSQANFTIAPTSGLVRKVRKDN